MKIIDEEKTRDESAPCFLFLVINEVRMFELLFLNY